MEATTQDVKCSVHMVISCQRTRRLSSLSLWVPSRG